MRRYALHEIIYSLKIKSKGRLKPLKKKYTSSFSSFLKNVWHIEKKKRKKNKKVITIVKKIPKIKSKRSNDN